MNNGLYEYDLKVKPHRYHLHWKALGRRLEGVLKAWKECTTTALEAIKIKRGICMSARFRVQKGRYGSGRVIPIGNLNTI